MTYNERRYQTLCRLGVEQLPGLCAERGHANDMGSSLRCKRDYSEIVSPISGDLPVRSMPVPGRRCPACMSRGQTVWVIPGKRCPQCGTEVN